MEESYCSNRFLPNDPSLAVRRDFHHGGGIRIGGPAARPVNQDLAVPLMVSDANAANNKGKAPLQMVPRSNEAMYVRPRVDYSMQYDNRVHLPVKFFEMRPQMMIQENQETAVNHAVASSSSSSAWLNIGNPMDSYYDHEFGTHDNCFVGNSTRPSTLASTSSARLHQDEVEAIIKEPKKIQHWTVQEHMKFLIGVEYFGGSKWNMISKHIFDGEKTAMQIGSHRQKYNDRQKELQGVGSSGMKKKNKVKNSPRIHDINFLSDLDVKYLMEDGLISFAIGTTVLRTRRHPKPSSMMPSPPSCPEQPMNVDDENKVYFTVDDFGNFTF